MTHDQSAVNPIPLTLGSDLTSAADVRGELLDDDQTTRSFFAKALVQEIDAVASAYAFAFQHVGPVFDAVKRLDTMQAHMVVSFVLGVFDEVMVSTQLLLVGKLPAAGNLMRQAIEGIAMATLCSAGVPLVINRREARGRKPAVDETAYYHRLLMQHDPRVQGHHAVRQLAWNAERLGVNPGAIPGIRDAQHYYSDFSHCGPITVGSRTRLDGERGVMSIGGHYDEMKLPLYRAEMEERLNLCRMLPSVIDLLLKSHALTTLEE
ncbi:hypothetical protein [Burkholderia gladioli]|uniref:hypothetical protein n=1 Tax=Burkholderia gladioli TaxID=28095 RepID=UPI00163E58BA|nr:hypothetical protein [Burkholderia gladioli]